MALGRGMGPHAAISIYHRCFSFMKHSNQLRDDTLRTRVKRVDLGGQTPNVLPSSLVVPHISVARESRVIRLGYSRTRKFSEFAAKHWLYS